MKNKQCQKDYKSNFAFLCCFFFGFTQHSHAPYTYAPYATFFASLKMSTMSQSWGQIKGIQFDLLDADEIRKLSVCQVIHPDLFSKSGNGHVLEDGPCDLRMGAINLFKCKTCNRLQDCPGHFGHLELAVPLFNVNFLDKVREILDVLCLKCCKIKYSHEESKTKRSLKTIKDICKNRTKCPHSNCGQLCPAVSLNGAYFSISETQYNNKIQQDKLVKSQLYASRVYDIFGRIPEKDLENLGLEYHPRALLYTALPILPNPERPTFDKFDSGHQRSVDKLTLRLKEIVILNRKVVKAIEEDSIPTKKRTGKNNAATSLQDQQNLLQDEVNMFYTSNHIAQSHSLQKSVASSYNRAGIDEGKPLQSRLQGKDGQLRGNLMGKRVNYSGRTVITGDPSLDLNQVGIPYEIAMILTSREYVWKANIKNLQQLVDAGAKALIGAQTVTRPDPKGKSSIIFDLRYRQSPLKLEYGDIVDRHLQNGDLVVFNRQPTLHRMSLMAMKAKIMKGRTFRMNVCGNIFQIQINT